MNYFIFKKMYHGFKGNAGHRNEEIKNTKDSVKGIFFVTQNAFDKVFEMLINKANIDSHNIPFWLMDLYNDFVRVIECKNSNEIVKYKTTLEISKRLYIQAHVNLGANSAVNLFKN